MTLLCFLKCNFFISVSFLLVSFNHFLQLFCVSRGEGTVLYPPWLFWLLSLQRGPLSGLESGLLFNTQK